MEIAMIVAIAGVVVTSFVAYTARKINYRTQLTLAVIINGFMELGLNDEAIGRALEPLIQEGCVSIMWEAGGHRRLQVSKKGIGILGRIGKIAKMPRAPMDIKWE